MDSGGWISVDGHDSLMHHCCICFHNVRWQDKQDGYRLRI